MTPAPLRTLAWAAALASASAACGEDLPQLRLLGPDILRLNFDTRSLVASDVDGDGLTDLAVIDNQEGGIQICLQLAPGQEPRQRRRVVRNRWEPVIEDARFDRVPVPIGLRLFDLAVADFNGDGRRDLAFTAEPGGLYVRFQDEQGDFEKERRFDIAEPNQNGTALLATDLDGDGRADLVMAARRHIHIYRQGADGELQSSETLTLVDELSAAIQAHDVNGDQRPDLVYLAPQGTYALRVRLQEADGRFGPERSFRLGGAITVLARVRGGPDQPVSYAFVRDQPRRVELLQFREAGPDAPPRPLVFPSRPGARVPASHAIGDFNGDGRRDVAVADPEGAQVLVYLQETDGTLASARRFPSFADIRSLAAADWNGDGRDDLFVVSVREQAAGVSLAQPDGRLGFPRALGVTGKPACVAAGDLDGDGIPEAVVATEEGGRRSLQVMRSERASGLPAFEPLVIAGTRTDPKAIQVIHGRGTRPDLALFFNFEPVRIVLNDGAALKDAPAGAGLRRGAREGIEPAGFIPTDFDGDGRDEFLAAGTGFARLLRIGDDGAVDVVEQFNARDGANELQAAFAADIDGDGTREVVLVPRKGDALEVLSRGEDGTYAFDSVLEVGEIDLVDVRVLALGAERRDDVLLFGRDRFWLLSRGATGLTTEIVGSYETDLDGIFATDVEAGDLRGEGRDLLVVLDQQRNVVEFAVPDGDLWRPLSHFVVFERDPHSQNPRAQGSGEPRQTVLADVTGDGRTDLVLLVHDRVLVYPQAAP